MSSCNCSVKVNNSLDMNKWMIITLYKLMSVMKTKQACEMLNV